MKQEIGHEVQRAYEKGLEQCSDWHVKRATDNILALFADKVRGIDQSDIKGINPGEYDSSTVALCDGFEAFRKAILKELEQ